MLSLSGNEDEGNKGHRLNYRLFIYGYEVEDKPVCPFPLPSRCWTPGRKWHHEGWRRFGAMACSSPQFSGAHTLWRWSWNLSTSTAWWKEPLIQIWQRDKKRWEIKAPESRCIENAHKHILSINYRWPLSVEGNSVVLIEQGKQCWLLWIYTVRVKKWLI